eukprot:TRINITY_DN51399_c0_g1_i1.p1 TRINITY_DN51399_c0_g1~~TRINITY_DN51399_c0_g1_i1.p1  ORF type:complete len:1068 (-),score=194.44 TRINITY_DN51399_c0_g1_i1:73-3276(-)
MPRGPLNQTVFQPVPGAAAITPSSSVQLSRSSGMDARDSEPPRRPAVKEGSSAVDSKNVEVWSKTGKKWFPARIAGEFEDGDIEVEYEVNGTMVSKKLRKDSQNIKKVFTQAEDGEEVSIYEAPLVGSDTLGGSKDSSIPQPLMKSSDRRSRMSSRSTASHFSRPQTLRQTSFSRSGRTEGGERLQPPPQQERQSYVYSSTEPQPSKPLYEGVVSSDDHCDARRRASTAEDQPVAKSQTNIGGGGDGCGGSHKPQAPDNDAFTQTLAHTAVQTECDGESRTKWLHGEIEFEHSRHVQKYIIVPKECRDIQEVLAVACYAWNLSRPRLFVEVDGFHGEPAGWLEQLLADADDGFWRHYSHHKGQAVAGTVFEHRLQELCSSVVTACAECDAWLYTFVDHVAHDGFEAKVDLMGTARRNAKTPQARDVPLLGSHEMGWNLHKSKDILDCAVEVTERPKVPVKYKAWQEELKDFKADEGAYGQFMTELKTAFAKKNTPVPEGSELEQLVDKKMKMRLLQGQCSHIFIFREQSRLKFSDIRTGMNRLVPSVQVVGNGLTSKIKNIVLSSQHKPVILMRHTGGAADVLARAIDACPESVEYSESLGGPKHQYVLPRSVQQDRFIILDAANDRSEEIIDKIMRCVDIVEDEDMQQLGAQNLERERLLTAWNMHLTFYGKSRWYAWYARLLQYPLIVSAFLTTVFGVFHIAEEHDLIGSTTTLGVVADGEVTDSDEQLLIAVLPIFASFLLTVDSAFSPSAKWLKLKIAAERVKSEIYTYRTRVGDYAPTMLKEGPWQKLQQKVNTALRIKSAPLKLSVDTRPADADAEPSQRASPDTPQATRSERFAAFLKDVQSDLVKSEFKEAVIKLRPEADVKAFLHTLQSNNRGGGHYFCCSRRPRLGKLLSPEKTTCGKLGGGHAQSPCLDSLSTQQYLKERLDPLLDKIDVDAPKMARGAMVCKVMVFTATAACSVVALLKRHMWVPITTAFATALMAAMKFEELDARLERMNLCKCELHNTKVYWESRTLFQKRLYETKQFVVDSTEHAALAMLSFSAAKTAAKPAWSDGPLRKSF